MQILTKISILNNDQHNVESFSKQWLEEARNYRWYPIGEMKCVKVKEGGKKRVLISGEKKQSRQGFVPSTTSNKILPQLNAPATLPSDFRFV